MSWRHLLLAGLVWLAVVPATHATLPVDASLELKAGNSSLDVSVRPGRCDTGLNVGLRLSVKVLRSVVRKLFRLGGRAFFRVLSRAFPITSSLYAMIRSPEPTNPETVNHILVDFCVSLIKMVEKKAIPRENAELLHKQTIRELKLVLKEKMDTDSIDGSCKDL